MNQGQVETTATRSGTPLVVLATSGAVGAALFGDSMLYAVMPSRPEAWGLSIAAVGLLLSANRIIRLLTNSLVALIVTRYGSRAPFAVAMVLSVVVTFTYGWATAFWVLLLARLVWGLAWSALRLGAILSVLEVTDASSRGRGLGVYQAITRFGSMVGVIGGGLMTETIGHRTALTIFAALIAVAGVAWFAVTVTSKHVMAVPPAEGRSLREGFAEVRGNGRLLAVSIGGLVVGFIFAGLTIASIGFLLRELYGEEVAVFGIAIGIAALTGITIGVRFISDVVVAPGVGHFSDRIGRERVTPVVLVVGAVAITGLAFSTHPAMVVVSILVVFVCATAATVLLVSSAGDLSPPEHRASVMSTYATFADAGAALGPLAALSTESLTGLRWAYIGGAVLLLFTAVLVRRALVGIQAATD